MHFLAETPMLPLIAVGVSLCLAAVGLWRRRGIAQQMGPQASLQVALEATPQHGWSILSLVLTNHGGSKVNVEAATIFLSDLDAEMQSGAANREASILIRQFVGPRESLRVGLIESVYVAAGKPQGVYSFRLSGVVRCGLGGTATDARIPQYDVRMIRLSVMRIRRVKERDERLRAHRNAAELGRSPATPAVEFASSLAQSIAAHNAVKGVDR